MFIKAYKIVFTLVDSGLIDPLISYWYNDRLRYYKLVLITNQFGDSRQL